MNITILQKVITELKTEKPRLDYVLGILEAMMDMQPVEKPKESYGKGYLDGRSGAITDVISVLPNIQVEESSADMNEADILDAKAKAALKVVQEMGQLS